MDFLVIKSASDSTRLQSISKIRAVTYTPKRGDCCEVICIESVADDLVELFGNGSTRNFGELKTLFGFDRADEGNIIRDVPVTLPDQPIEPYTSLTVPDGTGL